MKRLIILLFLFSSLIFCAEPLKDFASALNSIAGDISAKEREQRELEELKKEFGGDATEEDKRWFYDNLNKKIINYSKSREQYDNLGKKYKQSFLTGRLITSLQEKRFENAKRLLRLGASPNAWEEQSVLQKVLHGYKNKELGSAIEAVKILFAAGMDLYSKLEGGWTPLYYAVRYDDLEVIKFLLENCAEVDVVDKRDKNPFEHFLSHLIAVKSQLEMDRFKLKIQLQKNPSNAKNLKLLLKVETNLKRISGSLVKEVMDAFETKYKKSCREKKEKVPAKKLGKGFWIFKDEEATNAFYNYFRREFKTQLEVEKATNELKIKLKLEKKEKK